MTYIIKVIPRRRECKNVMPSDRITPFVCLELLFIRERPGIPAAPWKLRVFPYKDVRGMSGEIHGLTCGFQYANMYGGVKSPVFSRG